jgi:hypothetical protein
VMFVLITVALIRFQRRIHSVHLRPPAPPEAKTSPSPIQTKEAQ